MSRNVPPGKDRTSRDGSRGTVPGFMADWCDVLRGGVMDPFALVLNAGSSSLKFCLFQQPSRAAWRVEARGQIEGLGTAPRLTVKDGSGAKRIDEKLDPAVRDGRAAIDTLAAWLR